MEYINKNRRCVFLALSCSTQFNKHIEEMKENRHFLWCMHGGGGHGAYQGVTVKPVKYQCLLGRSIGFVVT